MDSPPSQCFVNIASFTNCTKPHEDGIRNTVFMVSAGDRGSFLSLFFVGGEHVFPYLHFLSSVAKSWKSFFLKYSQIVLSPYNTYWYACENSCWLDRELTGALL